MQPPRPPPGPQVEVKAPPDVVSPPIETVAQDLLRLGFHEAVAEFKRQLLAHAIASCRGNRAEAARLLGLQRTYLYRLARQLGEGNADAVEPVSSEA